MNAVIYIGCPEEYVFYNEHCYGFSGESLAWDDAQNRCNGLGDGYNLVVIDNEEENKFLTNHRNTKYIGNEYWIGLIRTSTSSVDPNDEFSWVDANTKPYRNWSQKTGEPNDVKLAILLSIIMH